MKKEFSLSEKIKWDEHNEGYAFSEDVKEFIKRNNDIDNELADEIFRLQQRGERIDTLLLITKVQKKRDNLAGDKLT